MGIQGVKCTLTISDFKNAIIKSRGRVVQAAKMVDLDRTTFHTKITEYGLRDLLAEARTHYEEDIVDISEDFNEWAIQHKEEMPSLAQRSAFYILDNIGKKRGYNQPNDANKPIPRAEEIDLEDENTKLKYKIMQLEKDSGIERQADNQL